MGILPSTTCICPACFEEIHLGECAIVSGITTNAPPIKPMTKGPFARLSRVEPLDGPKYALQKAQRQCTECGYLLPYNIETVNSVTLSVVGDTTSGKSHFIAAFIYQLQTFWLGTNSFAQFECLTPDVESTYERDYFEPLFQTRMQISPNQPIQLPSANQKLKLEPLIYKLTVSSSPRRPPTTINLMIYDSAGEAYENTDRLVQVGRFVFNTTALIFVIDPYKMTASFTGSANSLAGGASGGTFVPSNAPANSITRIVNIFNRYHKEGSALSRLPVGILVSKSDLFKPIYPINQYTFMKDPLYMTDPDYRGTLDMNDIDVVDQEVQELLRSYKQNSVISVTSRFRHKKFFASSATGEPLDQVTQKFPSVTPRRCLDPILWILHELSVIKGY